jgi:hypothetical protein
MAETKQPTVDELEKKEEELFRTGPLSVLTTSVKSNSQVLINCRWAQLSLQVHLCAYQFCRHAMRDCSPIQLHTHRFTTVFRA